MKGSRERSKDRSLDIDYESRTPSVHTKCGRNRKEHELVEEQRNLQLLSGTQLSISPYFKELAQNHADPVASTGSHTANGHGNKDGTSRSYIKRNLRKWFITSTIKY